VDAPTETSPKSAAEARGGELALSFEGVEKRFGSRFGAVRLLRRGPAPRSALAEIDLRLPPGSSLGLVGPNGAGKSTLLALAAGLERPSAGRVRIFGRDPRDPGGRGTPPARSRIGYLPETDAFPLELGAARALELCAALSGLERPLRRTRVPAMLERVGLAGARGRLATFSRGMRRRFGLAQAFVHEPDLLLFDEAASGLDAAGTLVFAELLEEARARGASVVTCSHEPAELGAGLDALAVLCDGRLVAHGPVEELVGDRGARLEVEGLDAPALDALADEIARRGGTLTGRAPSRAALLALYRGSAARTAEREGGA